MKVAQPFVPTEFSDFDPEDRPMFDEWVRVRNVPGDPASRVLRKGHGKAPTHPNPRTQDVHRASVPLSKVVPFGLLVVALVCVVILVRGNPGKKTPGDLGAAVTQPVRDLVGEGSATVRLELGNDLIAERGRLQPQTNYRATLVVQADPSVVELEPIDASEGYVGQPKGAEPDLSLDVNVSALEQGNGKFEIPFSFVTPDQSKAGGPKVQFKLELQAHFRAKQADGGSFEVQAPLQSEDLSLAPPPSVPPPDNFEIFLAKFKRYTAAQQHSWILAHPNAPHIVQLRHVAKRYTPPKKSVADPAREQRDFESLLRRFKKWSRAQQQAWLQRNSTHPHIDQLRAIAKPATDHTQDFKRFDGDGD